jgi:hypothetical protein
MTRTAENSTEAAPLRVVGRPFEKGQSGNPGGRPKGIAARAREATGDGAALIAYLVAVVENPAERTADRLEAAKLLLDRGWGRALAPRVELDRAALLAPAAR